MKSLMHSFLVLAGFTLFFSSVIIYPIAAIERGFYFGGSAAYLMEAPNDFDGDTFLYNPNDPDTVYDIPDMASTSTGFAARFGIKAMIWALDFQFSQNIFEKVDTAINQLEGNVFMAFYDLNLKYYLMEDFRAGIYGIIGLGYSTITGEKIKLSGTSPNYRYSTTSYAGVGFNLGVGMDYYLTRNVFLYGEYLYRMNAYTLVDDLEIAEPLNAPYHSVYVGLAYALPK